MSPGRLRRLARWRRSQWPDAQLIEASLEDPELFGEVYDRHKQRLVAYLEKRTNHDIGMDLASETFTIAFASRHRYEPRYSSARPWFFGIATKLLLRHWRGEYRRRDAMRRLAIVEATREDDFTEEATEHLTAHFAERDLQRAIECLNDDDREVLMLSAWGQLTHTEVAEAMDTPLGTVKSRMHRAQHIVRSQVAKR